MTISRNKNKRYGRDNNIENTANFMTENEKLNGVCPKVWPLPVKMQRKVTVTNHKDIHTSMLRKLIRNIYFSNKKDSLISNL